MYIKPKYLLSLVLFAFLLSACTNKGSKATDSNSVSELNLGVMSSMDYFPIALAKEKGFFEQEGVMVTINKFYSANERDAAFQSGNLDGTILDYTGAAIQRAGGVNLQLTSQCDGSFVLVAANESEINSVSDLRSKSLAVSRNTVIDFCTDWVLQEANIALSDVDKVEINKIPLRLEMLRNGRIDATVLPDPFVTIALGGNNKAIVDIKDLDLRVTGIVFHGDVLKEKEKGIKSFYRAYNMAIELINSQPASTFADLLVAEIGVPAELVSNLELPAYTKAQLPQEKDLEKVEEWLKAKNLVPTDFNIKTLIAAELIP